MKNISAPNRTRRHVILALCALYFAVLTTASAFALGRDHHTNAIRPVAHRSAAHALGSRPAGLHAMSYWWLRRWIPV
jgi:hypothetical protein